MSLAFFVRQVHRCFTGNNKAKPSLGSIAVMKEKFAMRFRNASLNTLGRTHERNEMNTLHFKIRCFVATSFFLCLIFVSSPELVGQERSLEEKRADLKEKSKLMGENFRRMKSRFVESSSRFQFDVKFAPEQVFSLSLIHI